MKSHDAKIFVRSFAPFLLVRFAMSSEACAAEDESLREIGIQETAFLQ